MAAYIWPKILADRTRKVKKAPVNGRKTPANGNQPLTRKNLPFSGEACARVYKSGQQAYINSQRGGAKEPERPWQPNISKT